jgi:outer membrane receptor protein involved in Fe transport
MLMQTHFRESYTDRLMYWGGTSGLPEQVLGPGNFYPGGMQVEEYYTKAISSSGFYQITDLQEDNLGNYTGSLNNGATYLQYSGYLLPQLVLDLGLRAESSSQLVSSTEYNYFEEFRNYRLITLNENATVSRFDLLPLIGLRYEPLKGLMLHASYYHSVNRPQMRELAAYRYYDPAMFTVYKGNPFLESTRIQNLSAGVDWRHATGFGISAEVFYRDIEQPIEQVVSRFAGMRGTFQLTPNNMPRATVQGLKADMELPFTRRTRSLLSYLSLRAGGVLTKSTVEAGPLRNGLVPTVSAHQLSGTPDYSGYAGLVINHPGGFGFSAIYQVIGDRLFAVGSGAVVIEDGSDAVLSIPHYHEKGRSEISIQASYAFFHRRMQVILGAENLFRTPYIIYQDLDGDGAMGDPVRFEQVAGGGRYVSGQDLVVRRIDQLPRYYFRLMFTW